MPSQSSTRCDALLADGDSALLLVGLVVTLALFAALQSSDQRREVGVPLQVELDRTADDQRRARLVDQDRVDLVDHGEVVAALNQFFGAQRHVVAQVVEAELVVGSVGDVGGVGDPPLGRRHLRQDDADVEAEEAVHPAHPLGVTAGQVVVDRHDVDAVARQRVQVDRQRRDQRLALAGTHLGDVAHVQGGTAHDLDVEVPLPQGPSGRFPDCGERLRHQVVEALAARVTLLELIGLRPQLGVRQGFELGFDRVDLIGDRLERAKDLALAGAHELVEDCGHEAWLLETVPGRYRDGGGVRSVLPPS